MSVSLCRDVRLLVLEHSRWSVIQKHQAVMKGLTVDDLLAFVAGLKAELYAEGLVQGNFTSTVRHSGTKLCWFDLERAEHSDVFVPLVINSSLKSVKTLFPPTGVQRVPAVLHRVSTVSFIYCTFVLMDVLLKTEILIDSTFTLKYILQNCIFLEDKYLLY